MHVSMYLAHGVHGHVFRGFVGHPHLHGRDVQLHSAVGGCDQNLNCAGLTAAP